MTGALSQQQPHGLYCNYEQRHGDSRRSDRAKDLKHYAITTNVRAALAYAAVLTSHARRAVGLC
jgi:hypothetical protein